MSDKTLIIKKGRMIPTTEYRQGFNWRCNECGWVGIDLFSAGLAIKEAEAHVREAHPDLQPTMDYDDGR